MLRRKKQAVISGALLLVLSFLLVSCDAITAQQIPSSGSSGSSQWMNGGGRMNGGGQMNGGGGNGGRGFGGMNGGSRDSQGQQNQGQQTDGGGGQRSGDGDNGSMLQGMLDPDLTGQILSVEGDTVKIEQVEETTTGGTASWSGTGIEQTLRTDSSTEVSGEFGTASTLSGLTAGQIIMIWTEDSNADKAERILVVGN